MFTFYCMKFYQRHHLMSKSFWPPQRRHGVCVTISIYTLVLPIYVLFLCDFTCVVWLMGHLWPFCVNKMTTTTTTTTTRNIFSHQTIHGTIESIFYNAIEISVNRASCSMKWWSVGRFMSWWRHQMEIFSALLAICAGNSPVPGEFPAQRRVTRSFDVFFDLRPNKGLNKQSWGWWFETPSCSLWRHCNVMH